MKLLRYSFEIVSGTIICCLATKGAVWSQSITGDGTLSTNITSPNSLNFTITGGNRAGDNLFHSFSQFSVPVAVQLFSTTPQILGILLVG